MGMSHVLVTYASKHGSTGEMAQEIAETLLEYGVRVDCLATDAVIDLQAYDAVVLGSAVYMRRWRPEARRFLRSHRSELAERSLWAFSSGPVGEPSEDPDASWLEPAKVVATLERLGARGHVVFGGRMPAHPHGPAQHAMVANCPPEFQDRRDWDEIRAWAQEIALALVAVPAA